MNVISLVGRLGKDMVLRYTNNDLCVGSFTLANAIGYGDKKKIQWFSCQLWGKRAESLSNYLTKGQEVAVVGQASLNEYTGKDGQNHAVIRVNVSDITFIGGSGQNGKASNKKNVATSKAPEGGATQADLDDDIPF